MNVYDGAAAMQPRTIPGSYSRNHDRPPAGAIRSTRPPALPDSAIGAEHRVQNKTGPLRAASIACSGAFSTEDRSTRMQSSGSGGNCSITGYGQMNRHADNHHSCIRQQSDSARPVLFFQSAYLVFRNCQHFSKQTPLSLVSCRC